MKRSNDQIILVTGGTSGVGRAIAKGVAQAGAKVIIVSRTVQSGEQTSAALIQETGNPNIEYLVADLSLQASIVDATAEFKRRYKRLDVLVNVAGALVFKQETTAEGIDQSLAVNYLSHFVLTRELMDILLQSAPSRIVTMGGAVETAKKPKLNLDDLQLKQGYSGIKSAQQAINERVFFGLELAQRLKGKGVTSVTFHPGIVKSKLTKNSPWWLKLFMLFLKPQEKDTSEIGVYLALSKDVEGTTGVFYDDKKHIVDLNRQYDPAIARKLWAMSEELTGRPFRI